MTVGRPIRTLLFSTLYPSSERPGHGIFVETRLRELLKTGQIETRVVAPVPWFPSTLLRFGTRAAMARTPRLEVREGIEVRHPRYLVVPKVGMTIAPLLLAMGARPAVQAMIREGFEFDLVDAHYYYPDGVAAALLARWFDRPFVVTARGSDINLLTRYALPRRQMRWAMSRAAASIGVSEALSGRLRQLGSPPDRVVTLRNGVDTSSFKPEPRLEARSRLRVDGEPLLLVVGNLLPVKRPELALQALRLVQAKCPGARLCFVGDGPMRRELSQLASQLGLEGAVMFVGAVSQKELPGWYSAADLMILASSREGWPNVLLECMACGTPVVASRVGGVPEIVCAPHLGEVLDIDGAATLADAVFRVLASRLDRQAIRAHTLGMGWPAVSAGQMSLFGQVMAMRANQ